MSQTRRIFFEDTNPAVIILNNNINFVKMDSSVYVPNYLIFYLFVYLSIYVCLYISLSIYICWLSISLSVFVYLSIEIMLQKSISHTS